MFIYVALTLLFLVILALGFLGTAYEIAGRCSKTVLLARGAGKPEIVEEVSRGIGHSHQPAENPWKRCAEILFAGKGYE